MKKKIISILIIILSLSACKNNSNQSIVNNTNFDDKKLILSDLQKQLHSIADDASEDVVFISTEKTVTQRYVNPFDYFFQSPWDDQRNSKLQTRKFKETGLGSGVLFQKNGNSYFIITNNHVIESADSIKVTISEKKTYKGIVIGKDSSFDIAVVRIKTSDNLKLAKFGNSDKVEVGDFVAAVGNPYGLSNTMTFGIVSATGRSNIQQDQVSLTNFIQTDAAINPGNSGGALINMQDEVIGINALIYSQNGGSVGIGFAIPSNIATRTANQLLSKGKVEHGFLGIIFKELTIEDINSLGLKNIDNGILVTQVVEKSPAERYGVKTGDVIVEVNNKKTTSQNDFMILIGNLEPNTKINLKILRNNNFIYLDVILGYRPEK